MSPHPPSAEAGLEAGWGRRPRLRLPNLALPRARPLGAAGRLLALAAAVLAGAVGVALAQGWIYSTAPATHFGGPGTAFLATANCADWQSASASERLTMIDALGVAATSPDPENPGATMARGDAYTLFQQACSTRLSRPVLLYQTYNRAASFQAVKAGGAYSAALGH
jgi:hypothetical protein